VRVFAAAAALLAVAAVVLLAIPDGGGGPAGVVQFEPAPPAAVAPPPSLTQVGRPARSAARRFLADYLPFVYGRGKPVFCAASPELAARLASSRVRVPPGVRDRHPDLVGLDSHALAADLAAVTAEIEDGPIRYSILLTAERQEGRWRIVRVGAD
jgi:hypothetical protein